jgi:diphosphomevalonate decarboxylase
MTKDYLGKKLKINIELPATASWRSPSNIAIVKYWGKKERQLPMNPSISMSLSAAFTETHLTASPLKAINSNTIEFYFDGIPNNSFGLRISNFLDSIKEFFPFLDQVHLRVDTNNTFPHSAGIASSASAFSALALCLCSLEETLTEQKIPDFFQKASFISRLGSGSACRSVYGGITLWGETPAYNSSSNIYAVPVTPVHSNFSGLRDAIILVNKEEKKVSSSKGHGKMEVHPFAQARFEQAFSNTAMLLEALKNGDRATFIRIAEIEAMTLHALMMTSEPGFMLMEPETVRIINRIQQIREQKKIDICFTLDAGPNIHLLYFKEDYEQVCNLIVEDLLENDKQKIWIDDSIGIGPEKID